MKTVFKILILIMLFQCYSPLLTIGQVGTVWINDIGISIGQFYFIRKKPDPSILMQQSRMRSNQYMSQGILKMNTNDTNELKLARQLFKASIALHNTNAEAWDYLGNVSLLESQLNTDGARNNKLVDGLYYYNKAIELDSMNSLFYFHRGLCYYTMGDLTYMADYRKSCSLGNAEACNEIKETEKK